MVRTLMHAAALSAALASGALAQSVRFGQDYVAPTVPPNVAPEFHIDYGQSWESNAFFSFGSFGFNPQPGTVITGNTSTGAMATSAGISYKAVTGLASFTAADAFSIGRTAALEQQLLRVRDQQPVVPIITADWAFPASTWYSGGGGGLSPGAVFTGSMATDVLTAGAPSSGQVVINQYVTATGLDPNTVVTEFVSGSGGAGTYNTAIGQIFLAQTGMVTAHAVVDGFISNTSAGGGNIFRITNVQSGTVTIGDTVPSPALAGTVITSQISGPAGGAGDYRVRVGAGQSVASRAMSTYGVSWHNQGLNLAQFQAPPVLPSGRYLAANFKSVGFTQGQSADQTEAGKIANLADMLTQYDAMNLPGAGTTGLRYYLGMPAPVSNAIVYDASSQGTYTFCRTNAPGQGGPWSGRVFCTSPAYPWPFIGADNIHTGDYGTARWGSWRGRVRHYVQDLNLPWTPLWRPLTGSPITVVGGLVTVPFARPTNPDFATTPLTFGYTAQDGIKDWPNKGFSVFRGAGQLTLGPPAISGLTVTFTITSTVTPGDVLTVGYGAYGPGGPTPGPYTGVGGNLRMIGPPSPLFPGLTDDAWAWAFSETVTAQ